MPTQFTREHNDTITAYSNDNKCIQDTTADTVRVRVNADSDNCGYS